MSQKRNSHTERVLKGISKKATKHGDASSTANVSVASLREQYDVIREDIIKLKDDLQKGYDLAKGTVDKKSLLNQIFKTR